MREKPLVYRPTVFCPPSALSHSDAKRLYSIGGRPKAERAPRSALPHLGAKYLCTVYNIGGRPEASFLSGCEASCFIVRRRRGFIWLFIRPYVICFCPGAKRLYNTDGRPKVKHVPRRRPVSCPGAKRPQSSAKRL